MKVIDYQTAEIDAKKPNAVERAISNMSFLQARTIPRAQETTIQTLKKLLDNRFLLLRGLVLPEQEPPAPFVLAGPPGIWLIEVSASKGVFRAVDDQWEEMDSQTQKFRPARTNLPARTASLAQVVSGMLTDGGLAVETVEPVIFFTQPRSAYQSGAPTRPSGPIGRNRQVLHRSAAKPKRLRAGPNQGGYRNIDSACRGKRRESRIWTSWTNPPALPRLIPREKKFCLRSYLQP